MKSPQKNYCIAHIVRYWLLILALLGSAAVWGVPLPAVADEPIPNRNEALPRAVVAAFEAGGVGPVEVDQVANADDWTVVTVQANVAEGQTYPGWDTYLALAQWDGRQWQVTPEFGPDFAARLDHVPETLLSLEAKAVLAPQVGIAADAPGLWLPFPPGQTWRFLAGPYAGPRREAVAFGPVDRFEIPKPPPAPNFTGRERTVTAAAAGLVIGRDRNLVILRHAGPDFYETGYHSLASASIPVELFDVVDQGDIIGYASAEVDPALDEHVQFWVRQAGVDQPIEPQILSDWRIFRDNGYRAGPTAGKIIYRDGTEVIDCDSVQLAGLGNQRCHIQHFSPVADPLPPATVSLIMADPPLIPLFATERILLNVAGAVNLYRMNLTLAYPSARLAVVDAFPDTSVVEIAPGDVFTDTPNVIENNVTTPAAGTINLSVRLQPPAAAFNGTGTLAEIALRRIALPAGDAVSITNLMLFDSNGRQIPVNLSPPVLIGSAGVLAGAVDLQGRSVHQGTIISAGSYAVESDSLGQFKIGVEPDYTLTLSKFGYLSAQVRGAKVAEGEAIQLAQIRLPAGDVNGDQKIDILDLVVLVSNLGQTAADTDLNLDGIVDIRDVTLAASNYGRQGPVVVAGAP